jgi:hypothetical protein
MIWEVLTYLMRIAGILAIVVFVPIIYLFIKELINEFKIDEEYKNEYY